MAYHSRIGHLFLYGITVTEASFRKGVRAYARADLACKLLCKCIGSKVPAEILNHILSYVDADAHRVVDTQWAACTTRNGIQRKFAFFDNEINGEQISMLNLADMGVKATFITRSTPQNLAGVTGSSNVHANIQSVLNGNGMIHPTPGSTCYVQLSTSGKPLKPVEVVDAPLDPVGSLSAPCAVYCSKTAISMTRSRPWPSDLDTFFDDLHITNMHVPDKTTFGYAQPISASHDHSRILKVDGVADAVLTWDNERIKNFVKLLKLEVVPHDAQNPLQPELIAYHRTCLLD